MRHAIFTTLLISMLAGCQSTPPPAPGLATILIHVVAEPKAGVANGNTHVLSYDAPVAQPTGQFEHVDYTALDNIVVWLEPVNGSSATTRSLTETVDLDVDSGKPTDDLSAVVSPGEMVRFHNRGSKPINTYSVSDGNEFDLGTLPAGGSASYTIKTPGLIEVLTDSVKDPIALIYVAPTSTARMAHTGETVEFKDVRPGLYKFISWHPRLPGQTVTLSLPANQTTSATIKVGVNDLPKIETK